MDFFSPFPKPNVLPGVSLAGVGGDAHLCKSALCQEP